MTAGRLQLRNLVKHYGDQRAVEHIDLDIEGGEFFSLIGASGCGKTTTLRMVAGFEHPDEGTIELDGVDLLDQPAHRRPVNTVFQSYALFPFMTVADNVGFGLRYHDVDKAEAKRRVGEALALVQMDAYAKRRPEQLSGGQQQRVALARALVLRPTVLLLDEPLGALDAKLRKQLQAELRQVQREVGITFLYVTHDQEEALTMSDRVAVLAGGRVEQVGTPREVYAQPATAYVAGFLGTANLLDSEVRSVHDGVARCRIGALEVLASAPPGTAVGRGQVVVRPERVRLAPDGGDPVDTTESTSKSSPGNCYRGKVCELVFQGPTTQATVDVDGIRLVAVVPNADWTAPAWLATDESVQVVIDVDGARLIRAAG